jgi:hypothetical protein
MSRHRPRGNPFDPRTWGRRHIEILWPIGSYGSMDVFEALTLLDELLADDDVLGARQLLWQVGATFAQTMVLGIDEQDDLFLANEVERFLAQLEEFG